MNGKGTFKLPDGRMYQGEYLNDRKHGKGVFIYPDGRRREGVWHNGKKVKSKNNELQIPKPSSYGNGELDQILK